MSLSTNLEGRLRNTNLAKKNGMFPFFEAVVNSIHAIDDLKLLSNDKIEVTICRELSFDLNDVDVYFSSKIINIYIKDNGVGFTDENYKSFETLDSDYKIDRGCRGVGRLLWLKAFDHVDISSVYEDHKGKKKVRLIKFNSNKGVVGKSLEYDSKYDGTVVRLCGYRDEYFKNSEKNILDIASSLLEHCLWYFVRDGGSPNIVIKDGNKEVSLYDLYEKYMLDSSVCETLVLKNYEFELTHIKFRGLRSKKHGISFCASSRLVKEEHISGKIPGLHGLIEDSDGIFVYNCFVCSKYLDERVRSERISFDIAEDLDGMIGSNEITMSDIREAVLDKSKEYLSDYLIENIKVARLRVQDFVDNKAPRYKSIIKRFDNGEVDVDKNISDKDLELFLHKKLVEVEQEMLAQGHDILKKIEDNFDDYKERLDSYLQTVKDIKMSDLANYVSHRRVIIDLLERTIRRNSKGSYAKESLIHELIMPMQKDTSDVFFEDCNFWLIDERLAFHNYMASDKTIKSMPITNCVSTKEPDLCSLNIFDNPILVSDSNNLPLASITVVEIKRPMRNDARFGEKLDPIEQALMYLDRIRKGGAQTINGRPIPNSENIPGYCYVLCDLTPTIIERCSYLDLTISSDKMGYFGFHKHYKAYIEVISFDKLVNTAKERNRAFFDKLGLPSH
jgi:hypothetical protein